MKVNELILNEQQLLELNLRHALAAGAVGAAMMASPTKPYQEAPPPQQQSAPMSSVVVQAPQYKPDPKLIAKATSIARKYNLDDEFALEVVELAKKYQKHNFPKENDILALIGIESSFDPDAVSGLRRDPAVGLTQVRAKVWNIDPESLRDPEVSIKTAAEILHLYYRKLKDKNAAIAAYNVGWGEYRSGNNAEGYVNKFWTELKQYQKVKS